MHIVLYAVCWLPLCDTHKSAHATCERITRACVCVIHLTNRLLPGKCACARERFYTRTNNENIVARLSAANDLLLVVCWCTHTFNCAERRNRRAAGPLKVFPSRGFVMMTFLLRDAHWFIEPNKHFIIIVHRALLPIIGLSGLFRFRPSFGVLS